jgi:hypothetical protein
MPPGRFTCTLHIEVPALYGTVLISR